MIINKIRFYCHKVLPLVYDNSLSYYELLCKVVAKVNELIDINNEFTGDIETIVREVLNEWLADGTLAQIMSGGFYVTPQMYGATGDGITDDYDAFIAMLESGKLIYIPEGNYYLSKPVIVDGDNVVADDGTFVGKSFIVTGEVPTTLATMTEIEADYFSILIKANSPTEYWWLQGADCLSDGTPYILARDEVETNGYVLKLSKDYSTLDDSWTALIYHGNSCAIVNDVYMLVAPNVSGGNTLQVLNLATKSVVGSITLTGLNTVHGVAWDSVHNMLWITSVSGTVNGQSGNIFGYSVNDIVNVINGSEAPLMIKCFNSDDGSGTIDACVGAYPTATKRMYQNVFYANDNLFMVWTLRKTNNRNVGTMILMYDIVTGKIKRAYYMDNPLPDAEIESVVIKSGNLFPVFDCIFNYYDSDNDDYKYVVRTGVLNGNMIANTDPYDNILA